MSNQLIHQIDNKVFTTGKSVFTFYKSFPLPTLWLRADAGVVKDGDNKVSQWQDQSGNELHAEQSTDVNKPIYDDINKKLLFSGSKFLILPADARLNPINFCYFIVYSFGGGSTGCLISSLIPTWLGMQVTVFSQNTLFFKGDSSISSTSITSNLHDGRDVLAVYNNNNPIAQGRISNTGQTVVHNKNISYTAVVAPNIGKSNAGTANYLNGTISEILVYENHLSDTQRESVEQYLMNKYAL